MTKLVTCQETECVDSNTDIIVHYYRQCPHKGCGLDIAYCEAHGGDQRAQTEMEKHIQEHKP